MILRYPFLRRNVTEHATLLLIVSAHALLDAASPSPVTAPATFSAACKRPATTHGGGIPTRWGKIRAALKKAGRAYRDWGPEAALVAKLIAVPEAPVAKRVARLVAELGARRKGVSVAALGPAGKRAGEQVAVVRGMRLPFCARHFPQRRWRIRPQRALRIGLGSDRDRQERWQLWA